MLLSAVSQLIGGSRCLGVKGRRTCAPATKCLAGRKGQTRETTRGNNLPRLADGTPVVEVSVRHCGSQGACINEAVTCPSGASLLRDVMQENLYDVDLYLTWGKVWRCGGSGKCGQCRVKVHQGHDLLSPRTPIEIQKLKRWPWQAKYRLACQAWVGDGVSTGDIHVSLE